MPRIPIPGRGWFTTGTVLLALTGVLHTIGQFTPEEPELASALAAMRASRLPMMGMSPSLFDIFRDLSFTMTVTFFAIAALNALVAWHRDTTTGLLGSVAAVNVVWIAAFVALCYVYAVPPPLICGVVVWPFFALAWFRAR